MATKENQFDAKDPSLGYFYQVLYALAVLLEGRDECSCVSIESLDDVVVSSTESSTLYQLKHHQESASAISDRSSDFWKSIRIWAENAKNSVLSLETSYFVLVTTTNVSDKSILHQFTLEHAQRDYSKIKKGLSAIVSGKASETSKPGYEAYLGLTPQQQDIFLERIRIVDNSVDIQKLLDKMQYHLRFIAPVGQEDTVFEQVSGWWMKKSIQLLTSELECVSYNELKHRLDEIRDSITRDNLPDDFPNSIDTADLSIYDDHTFIKQLKLVNCGNHVLCSAISDFRRAFEQRSKWIRQNNCTAEELKRFDNQLYDYWQRLYSLLQDETEGYENAQLVKSGYVFYRKYFVEQDIPVRIREKFTSPYLSKGSCQILSDEKRIGWHPNYQELIVKYGKLE